MKLHKSIRQYAKFNVNQLDSLIELDSYELLESYSNYRTEHICSLSKFALIKIIEGPSKYDKLTIHKHKTDNLYMLHTFRKTSNYYEEYYYYFTHEPIEFNLHRKNKPAQIFTSKYSDYITKVELFYFENGIQHNERGPSHLSYQFISNPQMLELKSLHFKRNGKFYNKNGLVSFYAGFLSDNYIQLTFMKNNVIKKIEYESEYVDIKIINVIDRSNLEIYKNKSNGYIEYSYQKDKAPHKLDGPAIIIEDDVIKKSWWVNGKFMPDDIIHYEKGLEKDITKIDILKAMLFDQEYGKFLQEKFNEAAQID